MASMMDIRWLTVSLIGFYWITSADSFNVPPASKIILDSAGSVSFLDSKSIEKLRSLHPRLLHIGTGRQSLTTIRMQLFDSKAFGGLFGSKQLKDSKVETSKPQANVWQTAEDPATGKTYYYNTETLETRWDAPETPISPVASVKSTPKPASSEKIANNAQDTDPLYFSLNDANAPAHPQVSCSEFTAAGAERPMRVWTRYLPHTQCLVANRSTRGQGENKPGRVPDCPPRLRHQPVRVSSLKLTGSTDAELRYVDAELASQTEE